MRGWTIVVLVVLGAWFLIVGPPAILEPTVRAVPDQIYALIGWLYFSVFALPGRWVLLHIWSGFFNLTWAQFFHGARPARPCGRGRSCRWSPIIRRNPPRP